MMKRKNPIIAFLLAFIPGGGLLYLGKSIRGLMYFIGELALISLFFYFNQVWLFTAGTVTFYAGILLYLINLIDTGVTASRLVNTPVDEPTRTKSQESERFYAIILSFIPGLGHLQLGLMNRGMTLLMGYFGLAVMIIFVAILANMGEFTIFLAVLPVIWVYGFFDVIQQLNKKHRGEPLVDRTILEELEARREEGKKSKSIATFLAMFPGAGHLYLGLQRRGIQFMAAFLFSIYILDVLRLSLFMFLIPIIWFYSFFDCLQKASKAGKEELDDQPVINYLLNHQRWLGTGLILLGVYYLLTNIAIPALSPMLSAYFNMDFRYWFDQYLQTAVVCVLFIGGGIKLLSGTKKAREES